MNAAAPTIAEKMIALCESLSTAQLIEALRGLAVDARDPAAASEKAKTFLWHFGIAEVEKRLSAEDFSTFCDSL